MGRIRKDIRSLIKESGSKKNARKMSEEWYVSGKKTKDVKGVEFTRKRFEPGKIYVFQYLPQGIKTLPWYDANPVVLALDEANDNDVGINLNLLPIKVKEDLLDIIYDEYYAEILSTKGSARQQRQLSISWEGAKKFLQDRKSVV